MKKIALVLLLLLLVACNAFAAVDSETGDRGLPVSLYGKQSDGTITAMLVDADGKLQTSGGTGTGVDLTGFTDYAMVYSVSEDLTYSDAIVADAAGNLTVEGALVAESIEVSGSGASVLTMSDGSTSYNLSIDGNTWLADGEVFGGIDLSTITDGSILYDNSDVVGGFGSYDGTNVTLPGELEIGGSGNAIKFKDVTTSGQIQVDETLLIDLTDSGVISFKNLADGDDLNIGTDLTVDGSDIYFKGVKLN